MICTKETFAANDEELLQGIRFNSEKSCKKEAHICLVIQGNYNVKFVCCNKKKKVIIFRKIMNLSSFHWIGGLCYFRCKNKLTKNIKAHRKLSKMGMSNNLLKYEFVGE